MKHWWWQIPLKTTLAKKHWQIPMKTSLYWQKCDLASLRRQTAVYRFSLFCLDKKAIWIRESTVSLLVFN